MGSNMKLSRYNSSVIYIGILSTKNTKEPDCVTVEFLLSLQVKLRRGTYDDFIRALTPVIFDLFDRILQTVCQFDYHLYAREKDDTWYWDRSKLEQNEKAHDILVTKDRSVRGFDYGIVYSRHLNVKSANFGTNFFESAPWFYMDFAFGPGFLRRLPSLL